MSAKVLDPKNINIPRQAKQILSTLKDAGYEGYIVGGAVRDILMGRPATDWDFATDAKPDQVIELFGSDAYHMGYGTVGVPSDTDDLKPFEITTYRTEHGYSDSRRPDSVEWGKSLDEDLKRRDFTINAMAISLAVQSDIEIVDPFGGVADIKSKTIRAVGEPEERFLEDALRMMRAIRIASDLSFSIENETFNAIKANAPNLTRISNERIRDELLKIFASPNPYHGVELLRGSGILTIILPEAEAMFQVEQKSPQRHHEHDVGTHAMLSLKHLKNNDPIVRLATFIHDIGKPQTVKTLENGVVTFYNHEVIGGRIAKDIANRLRFSKKQTDKLWRLVRYHQFTVDENQTDSAIRRFIRRVTPDYISDMLDLRTADRLGGGVPETSWRTEEFKQRLIEVQKQPFTVHDLKITGTDVMRELDMEPGPRVGEILKSLYDNVISQEVPNEREALLKRLRELS